LAVKRFLILSTPVLSIDINESLEGASFLKKLIQFILLHQTKSRNTYISSTHH